MPNEPRGVRDVVAAQWTTVEEARARMFRLWEQGRILADPLRAEGDASLFPRRIPLRRPDSGSIGERFGEVRDWIRALEEGAREHAGAYEIVWSEIEHRQLGRNRVPRALLVKSREDALGWIGKESDAKCFDELTASSLPTFPELRSWFSKSPFVALEHADDWPAILSVVDWFRRNPRAGIYLRQIDVDGVDTKFVEARFGLFVDLLDAVLPPSGVERTAGQRFEDRHGLLQKPERVRFRILDPRHRIRGMSDIKTVVSEFAALDLPIRRVFVTENEINGLAFPELEDSIVIFGLGYGVDRLAGIPWLAKQTIYYWGDVDTHGFAILDRFRSAFPHARSILMDRETLTRHRRHWVTEGSPFLGQLKNLKDDERAVFEDLAAGRFGDRVRLEQERIGFGWVREALARAP